MGGGIVSRRNAPRLVDPLAAHGQEIMRTLGVPTGRDRTLEAIRQRRANAAPPVPVVEGEVRSGQATTSLLRQLADRGIIEDRTVEGGSSSSGGQRQLEISGSRSPRLDAD